MHFKSSQNEDDLPAFDIGMSADKQHPPLLELSDDDGIEVIPEEDAEEDVSPPQKRSMPLFEHLKTHSTKPVKVPSPVNDMDSVVRISSPPVEKLSVNIESILERVSVLGSGTNITTKISSPKSNVLKVITADNIPPRDSVKVSRSNNKISIGTKIKLQDLKAEDINHIIDPEVSKWVQSAISMIEIFRDGQKQFRTRNIFISIDEFFRDFIPEKLRYLDDSNCMEIVEALSKGYYQSKFGEMVNIVKARDVKRTARKSCNYDYLIPNKLKAKAVKVVIKRAIISANPLAQARSSSVKEDKRKLARLEKRRRLASPAHTERVRKTSERQTKGRPSKSNTPLNKSNTDIGPTSTCQNPEIAANITTTTANNGTSILITNLSQDTTTRGSTITLPREPITIVRQSPVNASSRTATPVPEIATTIGQIPVTSRPVTVSAERRQPADRQIPVTTTAGTPTTSASSTSAQEQRATPAAPPPSQNRKQTSPLSNRHTESPALAPSSTSSSPKIVDKSGKVDKTGKVKKFEPGIIWIKPEPKDYDEVECSGTTSIAKCKQANCPNPALPGNPLCQSHYNKEKLLRFSQLLTNHQRGSGTNNQQHQTHQARQNQPQPLPNQAQPRQCQQNQPQQNQPQQNHLTPQQNPRQPNQQTQLQNQQQTPQQQQQTPQQQCQIPQQQCQIPQQQSQIPQQQCQIPQQQQTPQQQSQIPQQQCQIPQQQCQIPQQQSQTPQQQSQILQQQIQMPQTVPHAQHSIPTTHQSRSGQHVAQDKHKLNNTLRKISDCFTTDMSISDPIYNSVGEFSFKNTLANLPTADLQQIIKAKLTVHKACELEELLRLRGANCAMSDIHLYIVTVVLHHKLQEKVQQPNTANKQEYTARYELLLKKLNGQLSIYKLLNLLFNCVYTKEFLPVRAVLEAIEDVVKKECHDTIRVMSLMESIYLLAPTESIPELRRCVMSNFKSLIVIENILDKKLSQMSVQEVTTTSLELAKQKLIKVKQPDVDELRRFGVTGEFHEITKMVLQTFQDILKGGIASRMPTQTEVIESVRKFIETHIMSHRSGHGRPVQIPVQISAAPPKNPPTPRQSSSRPNSHTPPSLSTPRSQGPPNYQVIPTSQQHMNYMMQQHPLNSSQQPFQHQMGPRFPSTVMVPPPTSTAQPNTRFPHNPSLVIQQPRMQQFQQRVHNNIPQQYQHISPLPQGPTQTHLQGQAHPHGQFPQQPLTSQMPATSAALANNTQASVRQQELMQMARQAQLHIQQNHQLQQRHQLPHLDPRLQLQQQGLRIPYPQPRTRPQRHPSGGANNKRVVNPPMSPLLSAIPISSINASTNSMLPQAQHQTPPPQPVAPPQQGISPQPPPYQSPGPSDTVVLNIPGQDNPIVLPQLTGDKKYYTIQEPGKPDRYELLTAEQALQLERKLLEDHERKKAQQASKEAAAHKQAMSKKSSNNGPVATSHIATENPLSALPRTVPAPTILGATTDHPTRADITKPKSKGPGKQKKKKSDQQSESAQQRLTPEQKTPAEQPQRSLAEQQISKVDQNNSDIDIALIEIADDEDNTVTSTTEQPVTEQPATEQPATEPQQTTSQNPPTSSETALSNDVLEKPKSEQDPDTKVALDYSKTLESAEDTSLLSLDLAAIGDKPIGDIIDMMGHLGKLETANDTIWKDMRSRIKTLTQCLEMTKQKCEETERTSEKIKKRRKELMDLCTKKKNEVQSSQPPAKKHCGPPVRDDLTIIEDVNLPPQTTQSLRIQRGRLGHISDVVKSVIGQ